MTFKNLIPWNWNEGRGLKDEGLTPILSLRKDMDDLFNNIFERDEFFPARFIEDRQAKEFDSFMPKIDVKEDKKNIVISAELPGLEEKDIEVSLSHDSLRIKGEKKMETEDKKEGYYRLERSYGSFSREVPLPKEIDPDKVTAAYKKGILKVTLAKTAKSIEEEKKIEVKAA